MARADGIGLLGAAPGRRGVALLALLCAVQFMLVLDGTIVNVALPSIREDLGFSQEGLQWVVSAYVLVLGGFVLLAGRFSDLYGRRRLFLAGLALFTVSSLLCGLANSPAALVGLRAVQGLGAAIVLPAALSILTTSFEEGSRRNAALSVWSAVGGVGASASAILGGLLTTYLGWEWVFFVNVPVGILTLALAPRLILGDGKNEGSGTGRPDFLGAVTITGGLALLVYALTGSVEAGIGSFKTLGTVGVAVALLALFVVVERRVEGPLVPLGIFRSRNLSGGNLVALALTAVVVAHGFLCTLYMQGVLGYTPLQTGLAFLPIAILATGATVATGRLVAVIGARKTLVVGMGLLAVGMLMHARISPEGGYVAELLPAFLVLAIGLGITFPASTIAATSGVDDEKQGLASGVLTATQQVGPALGLAVLVTLATVYAAAGVATGVEIPPGAIVGGYRWAFVAGAGIALIGAFIALFMVRDKP